MPDVDGVLTQLEGLLGQGQPPPWRLRSFGSQVPSVSSWQGVASVRAHAASDGLEERRATVADVQSCVAPLVTSAGHISAAARERIEAIRAQWRADQASFAPIATTVAGRAALLRLSALRVQEGKQVVQQAHSQFVQLAVQVRTLGSRLPRRSDDGVQAVDHHTFKQDPPTPPPSPTNSSDPLERLGLPAYNPASLSDEEARRVYGIGKLRIIELDEQLARQGVSLEERAKLASASRNALRSWTRTIQANQIGAAGLEQSEPNLTWDEVVKKYQSQGLSGNDLWRRIIDKSVGSRAAVDQVFGIDPKNPGKLPPIRPSGPGAPIQVAPQVPGPSPPVEHPPPIEEAPPAEPRPTPPGGGRSPATGPEGGGISQAPRTGGNGPGLRGGGGIMRPFPNPGFPPI